MPLFVVKFICPFAFRVPDGTLFRISVDAQPAHIMVHSGQAQQTRVYSEGPEANTEGGAKRIWYRTVQRSGEESVPTRRFRLNEDEDPFLEEVHDQFAYSDVRVFFELDEALPLTDKGDRVHAEGLRRLRQFVSTYARVSGDLDVVIPAEHDSPAVEIHAAEKYEIDNDGCEGHFSRVTRIINWDGPEVHGLLKRQMAPDELRRLSDAAVTSEPVAVHNELFVEARTLLHRHKNYKLALVVAQMAFEAYLQWRLTIECAHRGLHALPLGRGTNRTIRAVGEALTLGSLRDDLLGIYCALLTRTGVKDTTEYREWYERCYEPRNTIVHGAAIATTKQQALDAILAATALANRVDRALMEGRAATSAISAPAP